MLLFLLLSHVSTAFAGGTDSLHALWQQCERSRSLSNYDSLDSLSTLLYKRARAENNRRCEAYGLFYQGLVKLFTGKASESLPLLNQARTLSEELENDSIGALSMNALGIYHAMAGNNSFLAQQYFFRSLRLAEKAGYEQLKGRVYGNMLILTQSSNDTTALNNAFKIYDYGHRHGDYEQTFMGAYYLAMYYNLRGDNSRAEQYIKESLALHTQYRYDDVAAVYTLYSKIVLEKGDARKAALHAQEAIRLAQQYKQVELLPDAYLQYALVLRAQGNYVASNQYAQLALDTAERVASRTQRVACLTLLARNSRQLGMAEQALSFYEQANQALDTQVHINMDRLMHERSIMLEVEEKEKEASVRRQQIADQHKLNIVLIVTTLILLGLLSVIIIDNRRRNRLYKHIVSQNARAVNREKKLREQILQLEEKLAAQPSETPSQTLLQDEKRIQDLYERACQLMENDCLYKDPQLNRERLAELLGTNRTYLTKIIKEKSGMNYLQFVNSYRINEAVRILSDHTKTDYPLKQIWSDLGFNSPATFYKLFQQSVGITPSVYRKQFIDMEKEE